MQLIEKFEVKFKNPNSQIQRTMLTQALKDLYINLEDYDVVKRNESNDQTSRFMDKFFISKGDIITLLEDYAFNLRVTEWGDILDDRDRPNNVLYILYIPNAKIGNWDYNKSKEKLLYIKWNPINKKIISFHTMKKIQDTNRDELEERKMKENLSYNDIIDRVFYTGNDNWHLKKFYDLRKEYNGKDIKNVKLIATEISDEGYCDILFAVEATKDGTKKKELVGGNGKMIDNVSNEYQVTIRINDFWNLIEEFGLETKGDFTKKDVVALIQLSQDIKLASNDASFWWQGLSYWLTLDNASLMPCYIQPKFWDKFRPNVKVSKIIEAVLRQFGFFTQQIAMSIKRALIEQGYLEKV